MMMLLCRPKSEHTKVALGPSKNFYLSRLSVAHSRESIQFQAIDSFITCVAFWGVWRFRDWLVSVCWPDMNSQRFPPDHRVPAMWWIPRDPPRLTPALRWGSLTQAVVGSLCEGNLSAFQVRHQHSSPEHCRTMSQRYVWAFHWPRHWLMLRERQFRSDQSEAPMWR